MIASISSGERGARGGGLLIRTACCLLNFAEAGFEALGATDESPACIALAKAYRKRIIGR